MVMCFVRSQKLNYHRLPYFHYDVRDLPSELLTREVALACFLELWLSSCVQTGFRDMSLRRLTRCLTLNAGFGFLDT